MYAVAVMVTRAPLGDGAGDGEGDGDVGVDEGPPEEPHPHAAIMIAAPTVTRPEISQGLALPMPKLTVRRPWLIGSISLARFARRGPLCGPAPRAKSVFRAA
jgi:hypothetical protein